MKIHSYILLMLLGIGSISICPAQTLSRSFIGTTGSTHQQLSYTVGETVINTGTTNNEVLTQGFQQGEKIIGTFIDPLLGETTFVLYPNPTTEKLILEIDTDQRRKLQVEFIDIRGRRVIPIQKVETGQALPHEFDVSSFATATYILLLKNEAGQPLKSIRFEKLD